MKRKDQLVKISRQFYNPRWKNEFYSEKRRVFFQLSTICSKNKKDKNHPILMYSSIRLMSVVSVRRTYLFLCNFRTPHGLAVHLWPKCWTTPSKLNFFCFFLVRQQLSETN